MKAVDTCHKYIASFQDCNGIVSRKFQGDSQNESIIKDAKVLINRPLSSGERVVLLHEEHPVVSYTDSDALIAVLWVTLTDIPCDEQKDGSMILGNDWFIFKSGTDIEEIWHWFDEHHTKGVAWLMYHGNIQ